MSVLTTDMPPPADPVDSRPIRLEINNLTVRYGDVTALNNVSLQVREGEFICILGASGCGKSTLFNVVSGLLPSSEGRIFLEGKDVTNKPGQVGYMLQKT